MADSLTVRGRTLDSAPDKFGILRDSSAFATDGAALRDRLEEDGYLYLRGYLKRDAVQAARHEMVRRLSEWKLLDAAYPIEEAVASKEKQVYFAPDLAKDNAPLHTVLYEGAMMELYARIFGEPVRHFDYTWIRAVSPGGATAPHCDVVYMGRGTQELLTAWVPFGDIPISMGGLLVLENSHQATRRVIPRYLEQDVDTYCENGPNVEKILGGKMGWEHWDGSFGEWSGEITQDASALRDSLGGRWLTADFQMGDVLTFTMRTVHASLDNRSDRVRLSSDTRYQPASQPIDERWIGELPVAHGLAGKRGKIC